MKEKLICPDCSGAGVIPPEIIRTLCPRCCGFGEVDENTEPIVTVPQPVTVIYMRNVPGKPDHRALTEPLPLTNMDGTQGEVPIGFMWDGSSVPWVFQGAFPRHRHPIASARHDYRCGKARNAAERKFADQEFRKDVDCTSWKITSTFGYLGVRIGAFFGIGSRY